MVVLHHVIECLLALIAATCRSPSDSHQIWRARNLQCSEDHTTWQHQKEKPKDQFELLIFLPNRTLVRWFPSNSNIQVRIMPPWIGESTDLPDSVATATSPCSNFICLSNSSVRPKFWMLVETICTQKISRATPVPGEAASWERTTTASSFI